MQEIRQENHRGKKNQINSSVALELDFGEPSWKFSELSRAELASFEIRAEYELDFFFRKATFPKNVFIQMILFKHIVHTKP